MAKIDTIEEIKNKQNVARNELRVIIKLFEESKTQLMEAINIVESKLNMEIVHHVREFYHFVSSWKEDLNSQLQKIMLEEKQNADLKNNKKLIKKN